MDTPTMAIEIGDTRVPATAIVDTPATVAATQDVERAGLRFRMVAVIQDVEHAVRWFGTVAAEYRIAARTPATQTQAAALKPQAAPRLILNRAVQIAPSIRLMMKSRAEDTMIFPAMTQSQAATSRLHRHREETGRSRGIQQAMSHQMTRHQPRHHCLTLTAVFVQPKKNFLR